MVSPKLNRLAWWAISYLQSRAKVMRLYLLYTSFSFSGVYTRTYRIFMTYPPPSPIHNVEDILLSKKCGLASLQQHCFRGEGGSKYKVSKIFARDCRAIPVRGLRFTWALGK